MKKKLFILIGVLAVIAIMAILIAAILVKPENTQIKQKEVKSAKQANMAEEVKVDTISIDYGIYYFRLPDLNIVYDERCTWKEYELLFAKALKLFRSQHPDLEEPITTTGNGLGMGHNGNSGIDVGYTVTFRKKRLE